MGTKNNVNPNHYKTAGRERPGEDIVQEIHKQKFTQSEAADRDRLAKNSFGTEAAGAGNRSKEPGKTVGQANESANSSSET